MARLKLKLSEELFADLVGSLKPEEFPITHPTQESAAEAIDALYDAVEDLAVFADVEHRTITKLIDMSNRVNELREVVKERVTDIAPEGPWKYRDIARKSAPVSVSYNPATLPAEILRRPGIVTKIDGKVLDKLALGEFAQFATVLRDARSTRRGTAGITNPLKAPDTSVFEKLMRDSE